MAPLVSTIDVARPQDEVFSYVTDPARFAEWQENIVSGHIEGDRPPAVGSKCMTTRRIGFAKRPVTSEITPSPPRSWSVHGIDGPIGAAVKVTVAPLDESARSRVTIELDFEGHGIGKLLVPLAVRRGAQKEMPRNLERLKDRIEGDA